MLHIKAMRYSSYFMIYCGSFYRVQLSRVFDEVVAVDVLDSRDSMNLDLLTRPDLGVTFTKLHCWRLTQYTKAVFLDADTLVSFRFL